MSKSRSFSALLLLLQLTIFVRQGMSQIAYFNHTYFALTVLNDAALSSSYDGYYFRVTDLGHPYCNSTSMAPFSLFFYDGSYFYQHTRSNQYIYLDGNSITLGGVPAWRLVMADAADPVCVDTTDPANYVWGSSYDLRDCGNWQGDHLFNTSSRGTVNFNICIDPGTCPYITTDAPTGEPTLEPTLSPSKSPSTTPSKSPSTTPSMSPSMSPSSTPSMNPSMSPSTTPTASPTMEPTVEPTSSPSMGPTVQPTSSPTTATTDDEDEGDTAIRQFGAMMIVVTVLMTWFAM